MNTLKKPKKVWRYWLVLPPGIKMLTSEDAKKINNIYSQCEIVNAKKHKKVRRNCIFPYIKDAKKMNNIAHWTFWCFGITYEMLMAKYTVMATMPRCKQYQISMCYKEKRKEEKKKSTRKLAWDRCDWVVANIVSLETI